MKKDKRPEDIIKELDDARNKLERLEEVKRGKNRNKIEEKFLENPEIINWVQQANELFSVGKISLEELKEKIKEQFLQNPSFIDIFDGTVSSVFEKSEKKNKSSRSKKSNKKTGLTGLFELAKNGKLYEIEEAVSGLDITEEEKNVALYQWYLVAKDFGFDEGDSEMMLEVIDPYGSETIANAIFELGVWYLLGENGHDKDEEKAFIHLGCAVKEWNIFEMLNMEEELTRVKSQLQGQMLQKFEQLIFEK